MFISESCIWLLFWRVLLLLLVLVCLGLGLVVWVWLVGFGRFFCDLWVGCVSFVALFYLGL